MAWSIFTQGGGPQVAVGWAIQFLKLLGAPVTPGNIEFVYQWEKSEGGGGKFNPLNQGPVQGKPYLTTTGEQFGGGAADFASWDAGLEGAYDFLHYNFYKGVLSGLMSNNPVAARQALWASPWAASHYGYGTNWAFVAVPGGTPVLPTGSGGGSGAGGTSDTSIIPASPTCAWNISSPSVNAPIVGQLGGGNTCIITKVQVRKIAAGFLFTGALVVGLVGITLLVVYGLKETALASRTREYAHAVPGGKKLLSKQ